MLTEGNGDSPTAPTLYGMQLTCVLLVSRESFIPHETNFDDIDHEGRRSQMCFPLTTTD